MADDRPYENVLPQAADGSFTLPLRKWREIVFVGAMKPDRAGFFARDASRPLPPMRDPDRFAEGIRFRAEQLPEPPSARPPDPKNPRLRDRRRVRLTPSP